MHTEVKFLEGEEGHEQQWLKAGDVVICQVEDDEVRHSYIEGGDLFEDGWAKIEIFLSQEIHSLTCLTSLIGPFTSNRSTNFSNSKGTPAACSYLYRFPLTSHQIKQKSPFPFLPLPSRFFDISAINKRINIYYLSSMSNTQDNNSLLGFLKQKGLAKQPASRPNPRRMRSRSRDGKDSIIEKINDRDLEEARGNNIIYQNNNDYQYRKESFPGGNFFEKNSPPFVEENPLKRDKIAFGLQPAPLQKPKNPEDKLDFGLQDKGNKFLNGLVSYGTSFESARLESAQCLESLSSKLKIQITGINSRIDEFRNNMSKVLHNELKALKDQILQLVDDAFKESQRSIREYMKIEEQKLAAEVFKVKENLEKELIRIDGMKEEINGTHWRKVAGQVLATELEKTMEDTIRKAGMVTIGRWEMKNLSGQRLKTLQVQLRDLVRLKE